MKIWSLEILVIKWFLKQIIWLSQRQKYVIVASTLLLATEIADFHKVNLKTVGRIILALIGEFVL